METQICKKCNRELPYTRQYFPEDKSLKSGLRKVCRECNPKYKNFLSESSRITTRWTDEELKLLKNNYKNYTNQELHDKFLPNRSIRAIESKASLCGISGKTEETISRSKLTMFDLTPDGHFKMKDEYKFLISDTKKEYYKTHESWWKGKQRSLEQREGQSKYRKENGFWSGDNNPRHINPLKG